MYFPFLIFENMLKYKIGDFMNKKGYIQKLRMKLLTFFCLKKREKEEKKKREEAIRVWQRENYGKYYSKSKVFFLSIFGFLVSAFESKNTKKEEICLDRIQTTKTLRKDSILFKKIEEEVKEEKKVKNEKQKPAVLVVKKEKLKQKKGEVVETLQKYKKVDISSFHKCISLNVVLFEENKTIGKKIVKQIDEEVEKIDNVIDTQKKNLQNVSLVKDEEKKQVTSLKGDSSVAKVDTVLAKVELEQIEKRLEEDKSFTTLSSLLVVLDKMEQKEKNKEVQKRILDDKKVILEKIEKEEKKKKKITRSENDLAEIVLMETLIYNQIKKQKREIEKIRKRVDTLDVVEKKKGFLGTLMQFLRKSIKLAFSLFPFAIFKNKKIGLLTSSILVNNNIRSMRSAVSKKEIPYIEFEKVASRLRKSEEEVEQAKLVCFDSLDQIMYLKNEFLYEFGYETSSEIEAILKEMNQLENMIKSRTKELENTKEEIVKVKQGAKQKVKKLESIYSQN